MDAAGRRVLVTGGAGFIGRHIVARLAASGRSVRVLSRHAAPSALGPGVEVVQGDVADGDAVRRACRDVDEVHHAAACVELWHDPGELTRTNVEGTRQVIAACQATGVARLVFTSSASVVFAGADQEGVDESVAYPRRYVNGYAATKALAEQLVLDAHGQGSLRTLALRPHLVWGPGDTHFIPGVIARARAGALVRVGDGRNRVDVTYVTNLADAHLLAGERLAAAAEVGGRAFFISQGEPVDAWGFVGDLLDRLRLPRPTRAISYRRAYAIGAVCEGLWTVLGRRTPPPLTRFLASQMARSHHFDISAARRLLGYDPAVTTAAGLDRVAATLTGSA